MVLTKTQTLKQKAEKQHFLSHYRKDRPSVKALINYIQLLYEAGGPNQKECKLLTSVLIFYRTNVPEERWKRASKKVVAIFGEEYSQSILGHAYFKPYGYAGDFEIIDKMYLEEISSNPRLKNWDLFHHQTAASTAVRNRKTFFKDVLKNTLTKSARNIEVLDVASGPCRDLLEFFQEETTENVHIDCVEADLHAILHATKINHKFLPLLTFYNKNIFRFQTEKKYDVIWSAGLFDYFDDRTFVRLLSRLLKSVKKGGELIIGNFAAGNPTEGYMELFLDWYLYHRSPEQLVKLAIEAGVGIENQINIDQEEKGVNLFMRIQC